MSFLCVLTGISLTTILTHWVAFKLNHLPLPRERTAIYMAILLACMVSLLASQRLTSRSGMLSGRVLVIALALAAAYFLGCLRLTYFKEWAWDADVREAYAVIATYNQRYDVRNVGSSWHYSAALNYYRVTSGTNTLSEVTTSDPLPPNCSIYVLHRAFDQGFIAAQGLKVVYQGSSTEMVVAIRPELERSPITR